MSHILMAGVGAHGHTNPHLAVIAELVDRGHRVSWSVPASFAKLVTAYDFEGALAALRGAADEKGL